MKLFAMLLLLFTGAIAQEPEEEKPKKKEVVEIRKVVDMFGDSLRPEITDYNEGYLQIWGASQEEVRRRIDVIRLTGYLDFADRHIRLYKPMRVKEILAYCDGGIYCAKTCMKIAENLVKDWSIDSYACSKEFRLDLSLSVEEIGKREFESLVQAFTKRFLDP